MKKKYLQTSLIVLAIYYSTHLSAQFSGAFAPANWGTTAVNSDGMTYTVGAPGTITMTSGNNQSSNLGTNDFTIVITQPGKISFSWSYSTIDDALYDYPEFLVNNVATTFPSYNTGGGASPQVGTETVCVMAGNVFGFRMTTSDNVLGAATNVLSNFQFIPASQVLTVTPSPAQVCPGNTISLTASGASSYSWSGGISNGVAFTTSTAVPVYTLSSGPASCLFTKTVSVPFYPALTINASANPLCSGTTVTLTAGNGTGFNWISGPGSSTFAVSPTTNTSYTVTGTSSNGCTNVSSVIELTVSSGAPVVSASSSTPSTCSGRTVALTGNGAVTYTWSNGVVNGVPFTPSVTTTYTVTGTNGCGTGTAVSTVSIFALPVSIAATPTLYCTNSTATLTASSALSSYTWQPGNISGPSGNIIVNPSVTTVYTVSISDGTCSGNSTFNLVANQVPTITASASSTVVCPGGSVTLSASGGINYTWSPVNMTGANITISPSLTLVYSVTGDNAAGCTAGASQVIIAGTQPTLALTVTNYTICNGNSTTLTVNGANTYVWSNGITTAQNIVSPSQSTMYIVVGTNTTSTCTESAVVNINVQDPQLAVTGNTTICSGASTSLTANGATTYTWNPGNIPFAGLTIAPTSTSIYTVSAISSTNNVNCPVTATVEVKVNPNPTVTALGTRSVVCFKETNTVTASGATSYTWTTTNNSVITSSSLTVTSPVAAVLLYTVTGRDVNGCGASYVYPVNFNQCVGLEKNTTSLHLVNVYPNPNNGEFFISAPEALELKLINELGQDVRKISLTEGNNYLVSVNDLSNGVYFIVSNSGSTKVIVNK